MERNEIIELIEYEKKPVDEYKVLMIEEDQDLRNELENKNILNSNTLKFMINVKRSWQEKNFRNNQF